MNKKEMICICCPLGCRLEVNCKEDRDSISKANSIIENGNKITVTGNSCPKGEEYGIKEMENPTRTLTTTVRVKGGIVPVKTAGEIPKGKIMDCMAAVKGVAAQPPILIGDVILQNVAGTGINVIATGNFRG